MMYNIANENILLPFVQERISRLSKSTRKTWIQVFFLFKRMQVQVEQNSKRLLARKENVIFSTIKNVFKSCRFFRSKKWEMEGWTQSGQRWIYSCMEAGPSLLRLSWLCQRTSFSYGISYGKSIKTRRGGASC